MLKAPINYGGRGYVHTCLEAHKNITETEITEGKKGRNGML